MITIRQERCVNQQFTVAVIIYLINLSKILNATSQIAQCQYYQIELYVVRNIATF